MNSASHPLTIDIEALARPDIRDLVPYVPGKPIQELERELGIAGAIKLASNENPLGPSPRALAAIEEAARQINRYPEGGSYYLRHRLSEHLGVPADRIIVGSGSNEIIELLCHVFVGPGDDIVTADITFPMYAIGARLTGGAVVRVPLADLRFDLDRMADAITERTRIVFIANPNNPTGTIVRQDEVDRFLERVPEHVLVVFDEAYFEYVDDPVYPRTLPLVEAGRHVCVLRTFSKVYSLAGLRVGYGIALPPTVAFLNRVRMPFNLTSVAQAAALASLDDPAHVERAVRVNRQGLAHLSRELATLGCEVVASHANFVLVRFPSDARPIVKDLERAGIIVRGMVPFGMTPDYVRVSVGVASENERLVETLKDLMR